MMYIHFKLEIRKMIPELSLEPCHIELRSEFSLTPHFQCTCVFYAHEETSGGILKSDRLSVNLCICPSVTKCVSAITAKLLKQIL